MRIGQKCGLTEFQARRGVFVLQQRVYDPGGDRPTGHGANAAAVYGLRDLPAVGDEAYAGGGCRIGS